jgi:hypothetical protein
MIAGLAWMVVAHAALLLAAHALLRRIRTENVALNGVLFVLLHLILVSCAVLAAGAAGGLTPRVLGLGGAALIGLLLILGEHRSLRLPPRPEIGRATALLLGLIAARMLAQVWFLAPSNSDVLSYHLTKVAEWVRAGGFTREMGPDYVAPFSAGFELVETWWVVFLHHDVLIEMAGVEFAILAFLAVRLLAIQLGLSSKASFLASTLYVLTPTFNLQATSCLNDAPVAALVLALAALIAARGHPVLLLLPLGLMLGIKATAAFTLPGWILLAVLLRKEARLRPASLSVALPIAAAALAVGVAWYFRNFLWYGSPIYPLNLGTETYYARLYRIQMTPQPASLRYNLAHLVSSLIYDDQAGLTPISLRTAGWGIVAFSVGILAYINEIRKDREFRRIAAAFAVSLCSVLLMVNNDHWYARFVLFFPAILCIAAARWAEARRPVALLLSLGAALEFAATLLPQEVPTAQMLALMKQPWRERSSAPMHDGSPPGEPLGVWATLRSRTYLFYGPDYSRRVVYLRISRLEDLAGEMERQGLRFVYVNTFRRVHYDLDELVRQGRFRDLGNGYFALP